MKSWLHDNDIEMYSTHNKGKSLVANRFIRTLKSKIYKHITAVSNNVYKDGLDKIVNEYHKTYHRTIKLKPADIQPVTYIDYGVEKFKVGDHVRISRYKNVFQKRAGYTQNWSEEIYVIKEIKTTVPWTYVISALNC